MVVTVIFPSQTRKIIVYSCWDSTKISQQDKSHRLFLHFL